MQKKRAWKQNEIVIFLMSISGIAFLIIFAYIPMFGVVLAFKDGDRKLNVFETILNSDWVGLYNFKAFFSDYNFKSIMKNTLGLNLLMLLINFPAPIIFALLINEVMHNKYKKTVQMITIFPNFISWMVFGGIVLNMMDVSTGIFNPLLEFLGLSSVENPVNLGEADYYWGTIIITSLIKGTGWGSIIYIAAIAGIPTDMYEAAKIDGVNRLQKIVYITLPSIAPTITVFLLLSISGLLNNSYEHLYVFQNAINLTKSEVLATYVYKHGVVQQRYSYATAIGLFQSVVSVTLLTLSNAISKKTTGRGLF